MTTEKHRALALACQIAERRLRALPMRQALQLGRDAENRRDDVGRPYRQFLGKGANPIRRADQIAAADASAGKQACEGVAVVIPAQIQRHRSHRTAKLPGADDQSFVEQPVASGRLELAHVGQKGSESLIEVA